MSGYLVHIAGPAIRAGDVIRQRCAWCGALLSEHDLARIAFPDGEDPGLVDADGAPTLRWEGLVAISTGPELEDGRSGSTALWAVADPEDGKIPDDSCMALPSEATT